MAMTKKEKSEFNEAIKKANTLAALRWTEKIEKDVPVPTEFGMSTTGFDFNSSSLVVKQMWSECVSHGDGYSRGKSASQDGRSLFSTKYLALKALRHTVEIESAEKLLRIDEMIQEEIANLG